MNRQEQKIMANLEPHAEFIGNWPTVLPKEREQYCSFFGQNWSGK